MRRGLAALIGIVSLIAIGVVVGVAADRFYLAHGHGDLSVQQLHQQAIGQFKSILDLDDEQVAAIDAVLRRRQVSVEHTWQSLHQHLSSAMDSVHEEIMGLLRPDQREKFRRWLHGEQEGGT